MIGIVLVAGLIVFSMLFGVALCYVSGRESARERKRVEENKQLELDLPAHARR